MNAMKIEEYSNDHSISEIKRIDFQAVEDFYELIKDEYSQDDLENIDVSYMSVNGDFFIASLNDNIIGMCGFVPVDDKKAELKRLRIEKSLRSKGYGSQLLKFVESDIKSKGFDAIEFATASIRKPTLQFYKKHGYIEKGKSVFGELEIINFEKILWSQSDSSSGVDKTVEII